MVGFAALNPPYKIDFRQPCFMQRWG